MACVIIGYGASVATARAIYFSTALLIVAILFCETRMETHLWGMAEDLGLGKTKRGGDL